MTKYINKAAVVAEIEKKLDKHNKLQSFNYGAVKDLESLLNFLDTLEVREVREESVSKDLEEAAFDYAEACKYDGGEKLLCVEHFKAGAQWQKQQNTLEPKEVGFKPMDSDFERDAVSFCHDNGLNTTPYIAKTIAKHFFELGLKAAQKGE